MDQISIDKKSSILLFCFFILIFVSIFLTNYRYALSNNINFYTSEEDIPDPFNLSIYDI